MDIATHTTACVIAGCKDVSTEKMNQFELDGVQ